MCFLYSQPYNKQSLKGKVCSSFLPGNHSKVGQVRNLRKIIGRRLFPKQQSHVTGIHMMLFNNFRLLNLGSRLEGLSGSYLSSG